MFSPFLEISVGFLLESFRDAGSPCSICEQHVTIIPSAGYADVQRGASEESLEEDQTFHLYVWTMPRRTNAQSSTSGGRVVFFWPFSNLYNIYIYPIKQINMRMGFLAIDKNHLKMLIKNFQNFHCYSSIFRGLYHCQRFFRLMVKDGLCVYPPFFLEAL